MDHGYFIDRISGYLDGELPDYEQEAVREHLAQCSECRTIYERLRQVDGLVEQHAELSDGDYWEQQAQEIEARLGFAGEPDVVDVPVKRWSGLGWKLTAAAASIAILVFIGINQTDIFNQAEDISPVRNTRPSDPATSIVPDSADGGATEEVVGGDDRPGRFEEAGADDIAKADETSAPEPAARSGTEPTGKKQLSDAQIPVDESIEQKSTSTPTALREGTGPAERGESIALTQPDEAESAQDEAVKTPALEHQQEVVESGGEAPKMVSRAPAEKSLADSEKPKMKALAKADKLELPAIVGKPRKETEVADLSLSATASAGASKVGEEVNWRYRADSLNDLWAELSSDRSRLALPKARQKPGLSGIDVVERQLLEAKYRAAVEMQESDPGEYQRTVQFFRDYIERPDALHRETARLYLEQLTDGQPDSLQTGSER